mmetsp:Transcript_78494/g.96043  ORF Transcript_78494/g.96043 Transcript_78494/m.96043 type:complete len:204 (+) Transcript_78494:55-666(+)
MATTTDEISSELKECEKLLNDIMNSEIAIPFNEPVPTHLYPDYLAVIKKPMDLGTILSNIKNRVYTDAYDFAEDVRLVWKNAKQYNTPGSGIYIDAEALSQKFERQFPRIKKAYSSRNKNKGHNILESTQEQRIKFTKLIKQINSEQLGQIIEIIDKKSPQALNDNENDEDLEIEIYYIDKNTLNDLIAFCQKCVKRHKKKKK